MLYRAIFSEKTEGLALHSKIIEFKDLGSISRKIHRTAKTIKSKGPIYFLHNYAYKLLIQDFFIRKSYTNLEKPTWKNINFQALQLRASGRLLLNPVDVGFSREFNVYGFREPLNTFVLFSYIAKEKPTILDIGGNLGYFPLIELEAGARKVVVVEPVPATFSLLSKTLADFDHAELLDIAISDHEGLLKLYTSTERNVTSSSRELITGTGHDVSGEFNVKACTLAEMAEEYRVNMIRMDVEGHEYAILARDIPKQINAINMELHVLPHYEKKQALGLLQNLRSQGFRVSVAVNEMGYGYYRIVHLLGLKNAYKLATSTLTQARSCPSVLLNPSVSELVDRVPEKGQIHLILER